MEPMLAEPSEEEAILRLRDSAAEWIQAKGAQGWVPGEVSLERIARQVRAQEWFVVRDPGVVAAMRLVETDEEIWGTQEPSALYVHGLVVARSHAGRGLGTLLLRWAETRAVTYGRCRVRLDCGDSNQALRAYYEDLDYRCVGRKTFKPPVFSVVLYEKVLTDTGSG